MPARVAAGDLSESSLRSYESRVRTCLVADLGHCRPEDVTREVAREHIYELATRVGRSTASNAHRIAKMVWSAAIREGVLGGPNPWDFRNNTPPARRTPVVGDLADRIETICWDCFYGRSMLVAPTIAGIPLLAMRTGMRSGEIRSLAWSEVDWSRRVIVKQRHKRSRDRGAKVIAAPDSAFRLLHLIRERRWSKRWVFPSDKAAAGYVRDLSRPWARIRDAAQLPEGTRLHDIRHGVAATMLAEGAQLEAVRDLLGHSSITVTEKYAGSLPEDRVREAAARAVGKLRSA